MSYHNLKCLNTNHIKQAEEILKRTVTDPFTMTASLDENTNIVYLDCPWCGYKVEVDVAIRPLMVKTALGKDFTISPESLAIPF